MRLHKSINHKLAAHKQSLIHSSKRFSTTAPEKKIKQQSQWVSTIEKRFLLQMNQLLKKHQQFITSTGKRLNAVSPLNVLTRGYAYVTDDKKEVVTQTSQVNINDTVNVRLSDGSLTCTINHKENLPTPNKE